MSKVYTTVAEVLADVAGKVLSIEAATPIIAELTAAAGKGVKAFKISADSPKGVFTITLPGMGMAIAPPAEALEALVANVEALKAALVKHGAERKATRAAYKTTPEYKASAGSMYAAASAAKARRAA